MLIAGVTSLCCLSGTRFRPLSFEVPKPLFPVAGVPMLQHHIEACAKVRKDTCLKYFLDSETLLTRQNRPTGITALPEKMT